MGYIGFYYIYLVVMLGGPHDQQLNALLVASQLLNTVNLVHMNHHFKYCGSLFEHLTHY